MCVHTTWPLVKVSPAMAENVMLFFRHQIKNLCFIMLVVLVITVPCAFPQGLRCRGRARTADRFSPPGISNLAALPTELHDNVKKHGLHRRCSEAYVKIPILPSVLLAWDSHHLAWWGHIRVLLTAPHSYIYHIGSACFRATHPPIRVLSALPISSVPLCCLLPTCERNRCLYT